MLLGFDAMRWGLRISPPPFFLPPPSLPPPPNALQCPGGIPSHHLSPHLTPHLYQWRSLTVALPAGVVASDNLDGRVRWVAVDWWRSQARSRAGTTTRTGRRSTSRTTSSSTAPTTRTTPAPDRRAPPPHSFTDLTMSAVDDSGVCREGERASESEIARSGVPPAAGVWGVDRRLL